MAKQTKKKKNVCIYGHLYVYKKSIFMCVNFISLHSHHYYPKDDEHKRHCYGYSLNDGSSSKCLSKLHIQSCAVIAVVTATAIAIATATATAVAASASASASKSASA